MPLNDLLGIEKNSVVAVVGCGGKTALIRLLAAQNSGGKVLVSPTTHLFPPAEGEAVVCADLDSCERHIPKNGVQYMGILDGETGKLGALPAEFLEEAAKEYDLVLLEADGSRGLPLKGWREGEPVVPAFCTHTVGVLPVWTVGMPVKEDIVLRLPEFLWLTGLSEGEPVTIEALARMVCGPGGMFRGAMGKLCLVVNQVEDARSEENARKLLAHVDVEWPGRFFAMGFGSVRRKEFYRNKG